MYKRKEKTRFDKILVPSFIHSTNSVIISLSCFRSSRLMSVGGAGSSKDDDNLGFAE